jgi:kinetochore protein Spc7/SPC105
MNFNNPDDEFLSSSPFSGSSAAGSDDTANQTYVTADGDDSSTSEDDGVAVDEGESTVMELDGDDTTGQSGASARSNGSSSGSTGSSGKLEAALRQAAKQAGTQGIEYDEHGDLTMDMADEEVTAAFQPWIKQGTYIPKVVADLSSLQDQENINPFSPRSRPV